MAARELSQTELARQSGVSRETIWRILNNKTDADPETVNQLSQAMRWPLPSYLMTPSRGMVAISNSMADAVADLATPIRIKDFDFPGWIWHSATREPEQEFRDVIWNIRLLAMLLLGSRKTLPDSEIRQVRLAICRMAIKGCELADRAVPPFVTEIHNSLIENSFVEEEPWFFDREREAEFLKFQAEQRRKETTKQAGPTVTVIASGSRHGDTSKQVQQIESTDEEAGGSAKQKGLS